MINKEIKKLDIGTLFSKRLSYLIKREYGEERGCKKKFYDDFQEVIEKNEIYGYKKNDEYFNVSLAGKHWISGANIPNAEILELLANFFCVSIDFLIGKTDIESSIDEDFIEVYTGLTPQSIRKLRKYITGSPVEQNNVDAINFLLDAEDDIEVLRNIYNYFFGNYTKTRDGKQSVAFLDDREMGGVDFYVPAMQQPLFLSVITNNISKYYETTIKNNPKYADYGKPTYKNKVLRCLGGHFGTKRERLEQVKNEIEQSMKRNELMLEKFKNSDDISKLYLSLIKNDKECLQIVEDMMNEI